MTVISTGPAQGPAFSRLIKIQAKDTQVDGLLTGNSFQISVEIKNPFEHLRTTTYIPAMARGCTSSFAGPYGDFRAAQMLESLYDIGKYVHRKHRMLKAKFKENRQKIADASVGKNYRTPTTR